MFSRVWRFYRDGFAQMRLGRTLWKIVVVKLAIILVVIKLLLLPSPPNETQQQQQLQEALLTHKTPHK